MIRITLEHLMCSFLGHKDYHDHGLDRVQTHFQSNEWRLQRVIVDTCMRCGRAWTPGYPAVDVKDMGPDVGAS